MDTQQNNQVPDKITLPETLIPNSSTLSQIESNYQKLQIKDSFQIIGQKARFQYSTLFFFCLCSLCVACVSFSMPFIYYEPQFYCYQDHDHKSAVKCTQKEACGNDFGYYYDKSIRSVTVEFDLVCEKKIKITRAQNVIVLVSGFGFYGFSFLSDVLGRKPIFFLAFGLMVLGSIFVLVQNNFEVMVMGHTIIYFGKYAYISVMYTYCTETMAGELGKMAITLTFILYGSGQIVLSCISFGKPFYKVYFWLYVVLFSVMFLLSSFLIETPFFYFKRRSLLDVYSSLQKIVKINTRSKEQYSEKIKELNNFFLLPEDFVYQSSNNKKKEKRYNLIDTSQDNQSDNQIIDESKEMTEEPKNFTDKLNAITFQSQKKSVNKFSLLCTFKYIKFIILFCIVLTPIFFTFGEFFLIAQKIGMKNIGLNSIILGSIDVVSNIVVAFTIKNINPKRNHTLSMIGFVIISFFIFLSDMIFKATSISTKKPVYLIVIQTVLCFPLKVIVCFCFGTMYAYANKLFPTEIRAVGSGACMVYSRVLMSFTSYTVFFTDKYSFHPLAFVWIPALIGIPASLFCPNIKADQTDN